MDELLYKRDPEDEDNYYELLGCDEKSTLADFQEWMGRPEQIATEYKILAKKYHPDKVEEVDKIAAEKQFVRIERAKAVLLDKDMREKYDTWRRGGFKMVVSFRKWLDMQPQLHQSMHWSQPQEPTPSLPEASKEEPNKDSQKCSSTPPASSSLQEFRRGSRESNHLAQFRTYGV